MTNAKPNPRRGRMREEFEMRYGSWAMRSWDKNNYPVPGAERDFKIAWLAFQAGWRAQQAAARRKEK